MRTLQVDGLICIGGDGTLSGMQALSDTLPTVLAPKTIDNDLGLNYRTRARRVAARDLRGSRPDTATFARRRAAASTSDRSINYVTPGSPRPSIVSAAGVQRIRTTAESHRRIAIVEVMGRHPDTWPWARLRPARHRAHSRGPAQRRSAGGTRSSRFTSCKRTS